MDPNKPPEEIERYLMAGFGLPLDPDAVPQNMPFFPTLPVFGQQEGSDTASGEGSSNGAIGSGSGNADGGTSSGAAGTGDGKKKQQEKNASTMGSSSSRGALPSSSSSSSPSASAPASALINIPDAAADPSVTSRVEKVVSKPKSPTSRYTASDWLRGGKDELVDVDLFMQMLRSRVRCCHDMCRECDCLYD